MKCAQVLSALALRSLSCRPVGVGSAGSPEELRAAPGPYVARALRQANAKAWFAVELLLAGEGLWEGLRRGGERGHRLERPLRTLFDAVGPTAVDRPEDALAALLAASESGVLTSGVLDAGAAFREAEGDGPSEETALAALADALEREGHPGLRPLLGLRAGPGGQPLLVALVAGMFRHAVESNPELFEDFTHLLKQDSDAGERVDFRDLAAALAGDGAWLEAVLEEASRAGFNGVGAPEHPPVELLPPPTLPAGEASQHLRRAEQHVRRGEYDQAIVDFTAALRADAGLAVAYAGRGDALRLRGDCGPALADFDAALRLAPGDARTLLNRGLTYALTGRHGEAIADFTAALQRESSAVAYNHRGTSRAATGDLAGAVADFTEALRLDPSSPWAIYNRGEAFLALAEYMAAVADFSNALRLNPLFTLGHVKRGDAYRFNGELNRAIADYSSALRLDPHNVLAFANRGSAYRKKKRYGAALGDFHAAIQLDPDDPRLHYQRGLTYRLKDEPERAAADFDAAARLDPSDPEVFYQRGLTNDSLGRKAAAKADLSRAIELAPDHAAAFNARGTLNFVLGDNKAAEADLCEALRLDPDFALAYLNRASVRSKVGFFKEAVADSDEAIRRDPGLTTAYLIRGSAYAQTEQFDSAIADFTEVLRRQADNDQAFYLRGVALSKTGDFAGAQADLTEALRLDPSNARAYAFRGLSHQALRRAEPAVRDFAHAVRLDGRYAAAYCNQRAALHSARGEYEQAVADYSLVLLLDPDNGDAKAARDQALRALLTRPAEKPEPAGPAVEIALEPPPAKPAAPEKSRPAAQTEARVARQDRPKTRPDAPKTGTMPKAPATRSQPAVAPPTPAAEAPDDSAEFSLGPANETPEEDLSLESPEDSARVKETPGAETSPDNESVLALDDADGSNDLLLSEPDSEAERSRQERFEEQHQKELARAEESARLQRLAVERQRMLEEVKRKKSDIDRARRAAKRPRARDNDGEGIAWDQWFQWGVRAALAAMVLWGCFWIYDLFLGNTISTPTCYPLRGSVKFADGRPVPGVLLLINGEEEREADIRPDGTFQTRTYSNTGYDGVPLGEYKVFVAPPQQAKDAIPPKYLKGGQTPWVVRVKRQDNSVDFVVQPDGSAAN